MKKSTHLVVIGYDEIVSNKYTECFENAFNKGMINGYTIIDLLSEKENIESRIRKQSFLPEKVLYLDNINLSEKEWFNEEYFGKIIDEIIKEKGKIKIYIATEVRSHEKYLRFCAKRGISSLTEKPIFAPMTNGCFDVEKIPTIMREIKDDIAKNNAEHSIMTLGRYHAIYNDIVIKFVKDKVKQLETPVTSVHLRHAGGVWNTHKEYDSREDHPYKYGYGMLMHGGYHYIDLVSQCLCVNKKLYPEKKFVLEVSSYAAFPQDQNERIGKKISNKFEDYCANWREEKKEIIYGETDITSTFCLKDKENNNVITLGTISLEQTTPSVRKWKDIPKGIYNKNGRVSSVELEVQLSTVHSIKVHCYDVPVKGIKEVERIDAFARVTTRSNASLLKDEEYITDNTYDGLFHSKSNKKLMSAWLSNEENISKFEDHISVMKIVYAIGKSIKNEGKAVQIEF